MGAARHFLKTALADRSEEEKFKVLQPTLEVNPSHPLIVCLHKLKADDPELAKLLAEQVADWSIDWMIYFLFVCLFYLSFSYLIIRVVAARSSIECE